MLVLARDEGPTRTIHLIIGKETRMSAAVLGLAAADITPMVQSFSGEQCILTLSYCDSEEDILHEMRKGITDEYPYIPVGSTTVTRTPAKSTRRRKSTVSKTSNTKGKRHLLKCSKCGAKKKTVPELYPVICYDCLSIELGIAASARAKDKQDD